MKIALTTKGSGLGAWLDDDFAHCKQVMIVNEDNRFSSWANEFLTTDKTFSDQLCQSLINEMPDILITGKINAECQQKLEKENIHVFPDESGFVLDLVEKYRRA